jgi:hypothetical protein
MLNIENKNKFGKVIADAIAKVELTVKDAQTKKRWINAISKAAAQIDNHGEFMTYDTQDNHLVIWSQDSNEIYTSNGVCQCKAFAQNQPCWHRAAARLVRLYLELPENTNPQLPAAKKETKEIPYLKNTKEPIRFEKYGSVVLPVYA